MGLLYLYRCVTMYVTNLPRAYDTYECASRTNGTFEEVVQRSIRIMLSAGMSVADELHTCGDWVFSGRTLWIVALWSKIGKNTDKIAIQSFTVPRARE